MGVRGDIEEGGGGVRARDQIRDRREGRRRWDYSGWRSRTRASTRGIILGEERSERDGARWAERFASSMSASLRTFRMFRTESHLGGAFKHDEARRKLVHVLHYLIHRDDR